MIKGRNPASCKQHDWVRLFGQFVGAGTGAPTNALRPDGGSVTKGITLTRTGVGLYTGTLVDGSAPFILDASAKVISSTNLFSAQVLTIVAATGVATFKLTVGGSAQDPSTTETIVVIFDVADAGQP